VYPDPMGFFTPGLPTKRLGDRLLDAGLISPNQLELALREQKRGGKLIGTVLQDLGFITGPALSAFLAKDAQTPTVDLAKIPFDPAVLDLLPFAFCKESGVVPIARTADTLTLVMADPFNVVAIDQVEQMTQLRVEVLNAALPDILDKLNSANDRAGSLDKTIDELMAIGGKNGADDSSAPMVRAIDQLISEAVRKSSSDIHLEPDEKSLRIRMRHDGVLRPFMMVPKDLQEPFTARIKVLANLDVSETRLPQDGRFSITVGRRELNLRVSCLPTIYGESIVMRILDSGALLMELASMGMRAEDEAKLAKACTRPHGIVLVTGPTGSGKTTTLYTALNSVNRHERAVFTLEDPIEYRLPYIRQTPINEKIGLTFSTGLRTLLRQDPDVLLVGETRDKDTAQLMARAALTGHLVFSSLHTNDSFGAIPRLIDLGVEPFLLPATLHLIVAQRLVRRLCPVCRQAVEDPAATLRSFNLPVPTDREPTLWKATGCAECHNQGYRGRVAIFEVLEIDDAYLPLLPEGNSEKIKALARERGMPLLFDDGLRRAFRGDTTLEEVYRVAFNT